MKEWFKSLFGTEERAHRMSYEAAIVGGKTIVSVDASESNYKRASDILESHIHTDDYGTGRGVETPNVYNAGYHGSRSDVLNAQVELNTPADQPGSAGHPVGRAAEDARAPSVRVYSHVTDKSVDEQVGLHEDRPRV